MPGYGYGSPQPVGYPTGGGGFLRGAMQTAAGVAAGALAFEGVESLLHGFEHNAGYGIGDSERPETINNYYGDSGAHEHDSSLSPDIEDRRDESRFSQAVENNDHGNSGDSLLGNDNFNDDSSNFQDDSSSFDDSSSDFSGDFDSGGGDDNSF